MMRDDIRSFQFAVTVRGDNESLDAIPHRTGGTADPILAPVAYDAEYHSRHFVRCCHARLQKDAASQGEEMNTVMNPTTGTIQRYRRKPLVVEAWQWWPEMEVPDPCLYRIKAGDWILKDLSTGQMSIVKHPTFKAMFELLPAMPISRALKG